MLLLFWNQVFPDNCSITKKRTPVNLSDVPFVPEEVEMKAGESYINAFGRVLNNFHLQFPFGNSPNKAAQPGGYYREMLKRNGGWDKPNLQNDQGHNSEKYCRQTPHQFYDAMDSVIKKTR